MNLFFWKRGDQETNPNYAPYEEIDAKKTSQLGYLFLILMVIFGVSQGNVFLYQLQDTISAPQENSSCLSTLEDYTDNKNVSSYNSYFVISYIDESCNFSDRERKLSLDKLYKQISPSLTNLKAIEENLQAIDQNISSSQRSQDQLATNYQLALLEKIAKTEGNTFNQENIQTGIITQKEYQNKLEITRAQLEKRGKTIETEIISRVIPYQKVIQDADDQYIHDLNVFRFLQFLISFFCVIPLFAFAWNRYHKAKNSRSEYTIIWGGVVATFGILSAQILLVFVYEILPLEEIFAFLSYFEFIWTILAWFGIILVPLFFGFLIYIIQKKFYNKQAVMMRALKNMQCPGCSLKINHAMNACPVCGYRLKIQCTNCNSMTMVGGSFCEICGGRHTSQNPVYSPENTSINSTASQM